LSENRVTSGQDIFQQKCQKHFSTTIRASTPRMDPGFTARCRVPVLEKSAVTP
jgi:hypothetical protein